MINLQLGWPTPSLHPTAQLQAAASKILGDTTLSTAALNYGSASGYQPFRASIATWLSKNYTSSPTTIDPGRITVTSGASCNMTNILLKFTDPTYTRCVWMIEPTYFLACPMFADAGFREGKLKGVPEDEEGIDLDFLRKGLVEVEARYEGVNGTAPKSIDTISGVGKIYKYVIYAICPTFSNPSAKTMSLHHRQELVKIAREYDALVISDDVYDFLRWPADPNIDVSADIGKIPPRLVDVDRMMEGGNEFGNTVSNGSFAKIIGPGIKVGWAEGTTAFTYGMASLGFVGSGGVPSHFSSMLVYHLLSSGALEEHITKTLIPTYSKRYHVLMATIEKHLHPFGVRVTIGQPYIDISSSNGKAIKSVGGYFTYLVVPSQFPPTEVLAAKAAKERDLKFAFGAMFQVKGDDGSRKRAGEKGGFGYCMRLSWAWHEERELVEGIKRIAEVLKEVQEDLQLTSGQP